jgi:hypothetical protein
MGVLAAAEADFQPDFLGQNPKRHTRPRHARQKLRKQPFLPRP